MENIACVAVSAMSYCANSGLNDFLTSPFTLEINTWVLYFPVCQRAGAGGGVPVECKLAMVCLFLKDVAKPWIALLMYTRGICKTDYLPSRRTLAFTQLCPFFFLAETQLPEA